MFKLIFLTILVVYSIQLSFLSNKNQSSVSDYFKKDYSEYTQKIKEAVTTNKEFKGKSYDRLAYIVDTYGPRLWGSVQLELAISEMLKMMKEEGFENARLERIDNMTHWVRGAESLTLYSPRLVPQKLGLIGIGLTVAGNITGQVIVIKDYAELEKRKEEVIGKIVLFNSVFTNYEETANYRFNGPTIAAKYGAIACLVRTVGPKSIYSPHTGATTYEKGFEIPAAAITLEDADMFQRMQDRGQTIIVNLYLEGHYAEKRTTYNVVGELTGSQYPNEILLMGGHIDSWDTGSQTGANDDGAGFMVCFEALRVLKNLGFRPKRTIRFIAWSGEEMGLPMQGAIEYIKRHKQEMEDHLVVFESDEGTTLLEGFGYTGGKNGTDIFNYVIDSYLQPIGYGKKSVNGSMVDNGYYLQLENIPNMKNLVKDTPNMDYYFTWHHSAGDSMRVVDPEELDSNVAGIASLMYVLADMEIKLPRDQLSKFIDQ